PRRSTHPRRGAHLDGSDYPRRQRDTAGTRATRRRRGTRRPPPYDRRTGRRGRHHRLRDADRDRPPLSAHLPAGRTGRSAARAMPNILQPIGAAVLHGLEQIGRVALFALEAVLLAFRPPFYLRLIGRQLVDIGYYSLPVVGLTAIFTGMVLVLQSYT